MNNVIISVLLISDIELFHNIRTKRHPVRPEEKIRNKLQNTMIITEKQSIDIDDTTDDTVLLESGGRGQGRSVSPNSSQSSSISSDTASFSSDDSDVAEVY